MQVSENHVNEILANPRKLRDVITRFCFGEIETSLLLKVYRSAVHHALIKANPKDEYAVKKFCLTHNVKVPNSFNRDVIIRAIVDDFKTNRSVNERITMTFEDYFQTRPDALRALL